MEKHPSSVSPRCVFKAANITRWTGPKRSAAQGKVTSHVWDFVPHPVATYWDNLEEMQILINISIEMSYIAFYQHTLNNYYHIFAHASPNIPFFKSSFPPLPPCNPLSCANISCEVWLPPLEHCTSTMSTRCPLDKETKCLIISLLCGSGTGQYTACSTSQYIARGAL